MNVYQDISPQVDSTLKTIKKASSEKAIESLLSLEKKARQCLDVVSSKRILEYLADYLIGKKDFDNIQKILPVLSKRHNQPTQALSSLFQKCVSGVELLNDDDQKRLEYITLLSNLTEGKTYVELERVKLVSMLSEIYEQKGEYNLAFEKINEIQPETIGSMNKDDKAMFILEQMRIGIIAQEFIKCRLLAQKISHKYIENTSTVIKCSYWRLMIVLALKEGLQISQCAKHFYNFLKMLKPEDQEYALIVKCVVLFGILQPLTQDMTNVLALLTNIKTDPLYQELRDLFLDNQLIFFDDIAKKYSDVLSVQHPFFAFAQNWAKNTEFDIKKQEMVEVWHSKLKERINEHNICVIAKYYQRINMDRIEKMLMIDMENCEDIVAQLMRNKIIYAKINRLNKIICFEKDEHPHSTLDKWSDHVVDCLEKVDHVCHLISKEEAVHNLR